MLSLSCSAIPTSTHSLRARRRGWRAAERSWRRPPRRCGAGGRPAAPGRPSPSAASTSRGPTLPGGSTRSRICSTPSPQRQLRQQRAEIDRRAAAVRRDRPGRLRPAGARSARPVRLRTAAGIGDLVGRAADMGLPAALGQHFDRAERQPRRRLRRQAAAAIPRPAAFRPIPVPSLRRVPSMPTARARGKVIRGFGWNPSLKPSGRPARRNSRSRHRIRSRCPISRRSPCLRKRIRTRNRTMRSTFPATAVVGGEPNNVVRRCHATRTGRVRHACVRQLRLVTGRQSPARVSSIPPLR